LANLLEETEGAPLSIEGGDTVVVPAHHYEIVTVKVDYPASVQ
jgi:alpha-mannosidase